MVLTIVPVLRALKALNAKLTLTNVRLDLVFINVPLIPFVSINLDGNFSNVKNFRKFFKDSSYLGIIVNVARDSELTKIQW